MGLSVNGISPADGAVSAQDDGSQTAQAVQTFQAKLDGHAQQDAAPKTNDQPSQNQAHQNSGNWFTRGMGLLQAGVGVVETVGGAAFGIATSETGIGAVAGGAVALHGIDDIQAGVRQAWSGKSTDNYTQQAATGAAQKLGASPQLAMAIGAGIDIAAGGGLGSGEKAAVKALSEGGKLLEEGAKLEKGVSDVAKLEKGVGEGAKIEKGASEANKLEKGVEETAKTGEAAASKSGKSAEDAKAIEIKLKKPAGVSEEAWQKKLSALNKGPAKAGRRSFTTRSGPGRRNAQPGRKAPSKRGMTPIMVSICSLAVPTHGKRSYPPTAA